MNTRTISPSLFLTLILLSLLSILAGSTAMADDDDNAYMGMGHMGMGHMGMGYMGSGHMGMGYMGSGQMGMGYMGSGYMGMGQMGIGFHSFYMLDLSEAQRKSIRNIFKESRTQQFALQDKISDQSDELYSLYKEDKPNPKKISAVYKKIFDTRREQIELGITTRNKAYDALTKEQKDQLKEWKSSGNRNYQGGQGYGMHHMMR